MATNVSNVVSGPAEVQLADTAVGFTQGQVQVTITPQQRPRLVDEYGQSPIGFIHTGDEVRVTVPWAQLDAATLAEVYEPGLDETASASDDDYLGFGRKAGYCYGTKDMKVIASNSAGCAVLADHRVQIWKSTPIGQLQQVYANDVDRILSMEYAAVVDTSKADGILMGKIQIAAGS